jgi:hypothetical protein
MQKGAQPKLQLRNIPHFPHGISLTDENIFHCYIDAK